MDNTNVKKNKKLVCMLSIVIAVVILVFAIIIVYSNTPEHRLIHQLNLGNRYLSELNFERAVACFETAITIDSHIVDAYSGLVDCYEGLSDPDGLLKAYSEANDSLIDSEKDLIAAKIADSFECMIRLATSEGNYDYARDLVIYLEFIDKDRAQSQLVNLNNSMCDALGHSWVEATCTKPRTCSRCGMADGVALGHVPTEADYWNPSICVSCGEELSPVLTPYFVEHNYSSMEAGKVYRYYTTTRDGRVIGANVKISNYEVLSGCDEWNGKENGVTINDVVWELPEKDGYEWRIVTFDLFFDETYAYSYTASLSGSGYYYGFSDDDLITEHNLYSGTISVLFNGADYDISWKADLGQGDWYWNGSIRCDLTFAVQVPKDYDGVVIFLYDRSVSEEPIEDIWDDVDTWFFQVK